MTEQLLESITIEPKVAATHTVIWLHGLGDSGAGFAPVVPMLNLPSNHGIRFIFPHAPERPVTLNQGFIMRAWYDIISLDSKGRADMAGVLESEVQVKALIGDQVNSGIPTENIVIAGFSQGGVISLFTGLRYAEKLAGIMALSCYLPQANLPDNLSEANQLTPIFQNHGAQDDVVPTAAGMAANELLIAGDYQVEWKTYPMAHSVLPEQLNDIGKWLQTILV